jgi:hypothetical protein
VAAGRPHLDGGLTVLDLIARVRNTVWEAEQRAGGRSRSACGQWQTIPWPTPLMRRGCYGVPDAEAGRGLKFNGGHVARHRLRCWASWKGAFPCPPGFVSNAGSQGAGPAVRQALSHRATGLVLSLPELPAGAEAEGLMLEAMAGRVNGAELPGFNARLVKAVPSPSPGSAAQGAGLSAPQSAQPGLPPGRRNRTVSPPCGLSAGPVQSWPRGGRGCPGRGGIGGMGHCAGSGA